MILAWNEIGRSAIFGREIEVPDREFFSQQKKKSILVAKIVISSTVDHCKMFYLPVYGIVSYNTIHWQIKHFTVIKLQYHTLANKTFYSDLRCWK